MLPKQINFNYSIPQTCFFNPTFLPNTVIFSGGTHFNVHQTPSVTAGNTPIFSARTCVELTSFSNNATVEHIHLNTPLKLSKRLTVNFSEPPQVQLKTDASQPVSTKQPIAFTLSQQDTLSLYRLHINEQEAECSKEDTLLLCPLEGLSLLQGKEYGLTLKRVYRDSVDTVYDGTIQLQSPLTLTPDIVQSNQTVYEPLSNITLSANKPIASIESITLIQEGVVENIPIEYSISDTKLTISTLRPLDRGRTFTLNISVATAQDGSFLDSEVSIAFMTSTGPKVKGVNIANYKVGLTSTIRLSFDSELNTTQDSTKVAILRDGENIIPTRVSISNDSLSITPLSKLTSCTRYSVSVTDSLQNRYGVSGSSAWTFSFRTICQQTFSIGASIQGTSITAYKFGNGPKLAVFVGGTHGDEKSSILTMQALVDELEQKYDSIPSTLTVVVIPLLNPDGYARSKRTNANTIDLNRNFPSNDWASNVYLPNNILLENGGGLQPLSEPESIALSNYIQTANPNLILTYHASGSMVIANESGNSHTLASLYAGKAGFSSSSSSQEDGVFAYPTTGEFETWTHDKLDIPTLLIELRGLSSNEIRTQSPAIWAVIGGI